MSRRVLITGVAGQDGTYLAERLLADGDEVIGTLRAVDAAARAPRLGDRARLVELDLRDPDAIRRVVAETRPDEIYHLAAPTFVPDSWEDPTDVTATIATGTATLLAAAGALGGEVRVLVATSSEIFGDAGVSPQTETSPMRPRSPYGVAKLAAHGLVRTLREHHGRFLVSAILYNHESPLRPPGFLPRKVSRGVAAIAAGRAETLTLGDLRAVRDWSHARDVVDGMVRALRHDEPGDYVLASGVGRTVGELVDAAFAAAGVARIAPDGRDRVEVDQRFVREPEPWPLVGDASKARGVLGWEPRVSFEQLVAEMVEADMAALRAG